MSGPATAAFSFAPLGVLVLADAALREARQMGREYQDVLAAMQDHAAEQAEARRRSSNAQFAQRQATKHHATRLQTRLERLRGLCTALGLPHAAILERAGWVAEPQPQDTRQAAQQQHLESLQRAVTVLEQAIAAQQAAAPDSAGFALPVAELPPVEEALHAYMQQRALHARLDAQQATAIHALVARLLARLHLEPGEAIPAELDAVAQSIALAPSLERAEALALDVRLRIQQHNDLRARQSADAAEARTLLDALGEQSPVALRQLLEDVVLGQPLTPHIRALAAQALQAVETQRKQLENEAAAQVLAQSLRDLGYTVDGVEHTFFVEGGVAHFQRHGWGDYFVRMRVGVQDKTLNFNVVRARGAQETAERKRLDYLAEDRWCAEFPKLVATLAARGIQLDVKRLLGAGELPVQAVDPASLPAVQTEADRQAPQKLREMK